MSTVHVDDYQFLSYDCLHESIRIRNDSEVVTLQLADIHTFHSSYDNTMNFRKVLLSPYQSMSVVVDQDGDVAFYHVHKFLKAPLVPVIGTKIDILRCNTDVDKDTGIQVQRPKKLPVKMISVSDKRKQNPYGRIYKRLSCAKRTQSVKDDDVVTHFEAKEDLELYENWNRKYFLVRKSNFRIKHEKRMRRIKKRYERTKWKIKSTRRRVVRKMNEKKEDLKMKLENFSKKISVLSFKKMGKRKYLDWHKVCRDGNGGSKLGEFLLTMIMFNN